MTAYEFVRNLWENSSSYADRIDSDTAREDLENFRAEGWDIPDGLTADTYADIWNELVEENCGTWHVLYSLSGELKDAASINRAVSQETGDDAEPYLEDEAAYTKAVREGWITWKPGRTLIWADEAR